MDIAIEAVFSACGDVDFDFLGNIDFSDDDEVQAAFIVLFQFFKLKYCQAPILDISLEEAYSRALDITKNADTSFWFRSPYSNSLKNSHWDIALVTGGLMPYCCYDNAFDSNSVKKAEHLFRFLDSSANEDVFDPNVEYEGFKTVLLRTPKKHLSNRSEVNFNLLHDLSCGRTKKRHRKDHSQYN